VDARNLPPLDGGRADESRSLYFVSGIHLVYMGEIRLDWIRCKG